MFTLKDRHHVKKYNCKGPPAFKSQRFRERLSVHPKSSASLSTCKQSAQFINLFFRQSSFYTWCSPWCQPALKYFCSTFKDPPY